MKIDEVSCCIVGKNRVELASWIRIFILVEGREAVNFIRWSFFPRPKAPTLTKGTVRPRPFGLRGSLPFDIMPT
jgi:hypothetical protein